MSSPIAIPRDQPSSASASSSLSTSNGKYVPVHKRAGAAPTPASPAPSNSTSGRASPRSRRGRHARQTSAVSNYEHNHHDIPIHTSIPTVYSIADLLAFSTTASPGPQLSLDQRASLVELLPYTYRAPTTTTNTTTNSTSSNGTSGSGSQRRTRRAGKKPATPRPIVNDVREQRRKQGTLAWGWSPVVHHLEEATWRQHAQPVAVGV